VYGKGRDISGTSPEDNLRQEAEKILYGSLLKNARIFYIPIHVNGVPWLALFTLNPPPQNKRFDSYGWYRNSQIYRSHIPKIAERLRNGSKQIYLNQLGIILSEGVKNLTNPTFFDKINMDLQRLTTIYPFDTIKVLSEKSVKSVELKLPSGKQLFIELCLNKYFLKQLNYQLITLGEIRTYLQNRIKEIYQIAYDQFQSRIRYYEHTIFNMMPSNNVDLAKKYLERSNIEKCNYELENAKNKLDIVKLSLRSIFTQDKIDKIQEEIGRPTVKGILDWLYTRKLKSDKRINLIYGQNYTDHVLIGGQLKNCFLVIWNLWHNG
jgi:hypothetical protein